MRSHRKLSISLLITSLLMLVVLVGGTWGTVFAAPQAAVIPTFDIVSVQPDVSVTIKTYNFPANDSFDVLMNTFGTRGVGGTKVSTVNSAAGGTFTATYNIPDSLKGQSTIAIRLQSSASGYYAYNWFYNSTSVVIPDTGGPTTGATPTFDITAVTPDTNVSVKTYNFPANDTFYVLMGRIGTRGVGGVRVETINTGTGGTFTGTYTIPNELKGQERIAVRFESPSSGYYSFNWFWNTTGGTIPDTGGPIGSLPPGVVPTFTITGVTEDSQVSIQTANFPANDSFVVRMGRIGTRGIGGTQVATVSSGSGGTQSFTFNIPDGLKDQTQIAIRLESPTSGYFSYNWFYNTNNGTIPDTGGPVVTPTPVVTALPPGTIPTISITGVTRDATVTIQTANYPKNDTFNVLMGAFGTKGVNGIKVGTLNSGNGGTLNATFNIPNELKGSNRITIRLESPTSGYYSFNWFDNVNLP